MRCESRRRTRQSRCVSTLNLIDRLHRPPRMRGLGAPQVRLLLASVAVGSLLPRADVAAEVYTVTPIPTFGGEASRAFAVNVMPRSGGAKREP